MVKAKVLQCDPEKGKMVLSFKAVVEKENEETEKPEFDCEVGKVRSRLLFNCKYNRLSYFY